MEDDSKAFGKRVAARRERLGLSQSEFARRVGMRQQGIAAIESGRVQRPRLLREIAHELETNEESLLWGKGPEELASQDERTVPLVGYVKAGEAAYRFDISPGELERVPAPGTTLNTVAVEIRGNSLGPFFDHWLVYYDDVRRPVTSDLLDKVCVVGLADDGGVFIKKIRPSAARRRGLYDLYPQFGDPMLDVRIDWAARVKHMVAR